ncbi:hypothetical protein EYF80_036227 [Liparis tanakae]|uniref:Uncharacterized protein n=1 Tax=Liparis tanakae TaxID=230148 RepID=A0A4Z2GLA9_9TELE|nr:hypothetical protein EYF80_036227 [Liparis tanakae]
MAENVPVSKPLYVQMNKVKHLNRRKVCCNIVKLVELRVVVAACTIIAQEGKLNDIFRGAHNWYAGRHYNMSVCLYESREHVSCAVEPGVCAHIGTKVTKKVTCTPTTPFARAQSSASNASGATEQHEQSVCRGAN